ncbi:hypothetical protein [Streptomyces sp. YS415]|uniref:hypothetical protein n=1 Tax=Streptomyces sp. YS415 TaxID=2944806 RepID=UPI002020758C|nr:hypothetical protein [Streptomyces sp. YS415]MCL7430368.1 hypothetical protein [Streptomyces sp. YS415]
MDPQYVAPPPAVGRDPSQVGRELQQAAGRMLRLNADVKPLQDAYVVVELEGPTQVAERARRVISTAEGIRMLTSRPYHQISLSLIARLGGVVDARLVAALTDAHARLIRDHAALTDAHAELTAAVTAFLTAARNHLNGDLSAEQGS